MPSLKLQTTSDIHYIRFFYKNILFNSSITHHKASDDHEAQIKTTVISLVFCNILNFNIKNRELKFTKTILTKIKTNEMYKYHSIRILLIIFVYMISLDFISVFFRTNVFMCYCLHVVIWTNSRKIISAKVIKLK